MPISSQNANIQFILKLQCQCFDLMWGSTGFPDSEGVPGKAQASSCPP